MLQNLGLSPESEFTYGTDFGEPARPFRRAFVAGIRGFTYKYQGLV